MKLLEAERVASKGIVLSLPIGLHPSHHQGNPYDEHFSAWEYKELRERGYGIYAFYIRGTDGELFENRIPGLLKPLWIFIKVFAGILTSRFPNFAGYMVAYKETRR